MANDFTIKISGLQEVQKSLYSYSQQLGDAVIYKSLRAGAAIVQRQAKANAPVKTGALKRGIVIRKSKIHNGKKSDGLLGVYITVRSKNKGDPYYGRFQEDGWLVKGKSNELRRNAKVKRTVLFTYRSIGSSRVTQPGRQFVLGKKFIERAFIDKREEAVNMIVTTARVAADILARKTGL
jgi:HK97 gp10 family phage protein